MLTNHHSDALSCPFAAQRLQVNRASAELIITCLALIDEHVSVAGSTLRDMVAGELNGVTPEYDQKAQQRASVSPLLTAPKSSTPPQHTPSDGRGRSASPRVRWQWPLTRTPPSGRHEAHVSAEPAPAAAAAPPARERSRTPPPGRTPPAPLDTVDEGTASALLGCVAFTLV